MELPSSIVGHERQREQLELDIQSGNFAHAYLFCGKEHLGKFTIAQWFAARLFTEGKGEGEKKEMLRLIRKNIHPDLLIVDQLWIDGVCTDWSVIARSSNISQEARVKHRVKTNTIGIDDVRELQRRLHETPETGHLCCLIRSLERLHSEAANALLKILEEPPPHVLFCCTCGSPSLLPTTIVSRMRVMHFYPLPAKELRPLLSDLPEEDQQLLLHVAEGAPGVIFQCLSDPQSFRALRQLHSAALRFLDTQSPRERLEQMVLMFEEGKEKLFLRHLFLHLQERLRSADVSIRRKSHHLLRTLLSLLHSLESNTQKFLLAADTALS